MPSPTEHLSLRLQPDVAALPAARRQVRSFLAERVDDRRVVEEVVLCVQEAMKNAVRFSHTVEPIEVEVRVSEGAVEARVRDYGEGIVSVPDLHKLTGVDPLAPSGRGLFLITRLSDQCELVSERGVEVRMVRRFDRESQVLS